MRFNTETIGDIIRFLITIFGAFTFSGAEQIVELLNYLSENLGRFVELYNEILGIATIIYGFFIDPKRGSLSTLYISTLRWKDGLVGGRVRELQSDIYTRHLKSES